VENTSVPPLAAVWEEESVGGLTTKGVPTSSSTFGFRQQKHIQSRMTQADTICIMMT
jgi:hypothetical protein